MKKILYLMAIDWFWIKQRPQMIAEMLSEDYEITVAYYKEIFVKQSLRKDKDELVNSYAVPAVPYRDKYLFFFKLQKLFFYYIMKNINKYDLVWISHPLLYRYIPVHYSGKIIYDCMDNHEAMCTDSKIRKTITISESLLAQRADSIFVSSLGLLSRMRKITSNKVTLVRNGFTMDKIHLPQPIKRKEKFRIGYFGTIAEWFDFELISNSFDRFKKLEYNLWGPVSVKNVPKHSGIQFKGVCEHKQLWNAVKECDALIMPFKVNDIIRTVDPVKLYEYISMGKTIITVYYEEIERFRPFVYFYNNEVEFDDILDKLVNGNLLFKYTEGMQKEFLEQNAWKNRYECIRRDILDCL